jgi:hypothetical protein
VTAASGVGGVVYNFDFSVVANVAYNIDPATAHGFIYETGAGNPNFASVELPDIGNPDPYQLYVWNGDSFVFEGSLAADTIFNFGPDGVQEFEVLGISPSLGLDPLNSNDFVTRVTFEGDGAFTGTMTPITVSVPEPATWAMMLIGFAGLSFAAYRRARSVSNAPSETPQSARTAGKKLCFFLLAWIPALTDPLPANARSQKVALPNGEVLQFNNKGGPLHSNYVMQKEGPNGVAWRILIGRTFVWDPGDKEAVVSWLNSRSGQGLVKKWMTVGDSRGTVFHNADEILKNYFGGSPR